MGAFDHYRTYFCRPDAEYVDPVAEKIERMVNGRR